MYELHYADYIIFGAVMLVSGLIGPFYMWRDRNRPTDSENYFMGGRKLHIIPTAASLFASFWSAAGMIGIPAELYTAGARFIMNSVGDAIGITIGAIFVVPVFYNLKLISSLQYLEMRFGSRILRKICSALTLLSLLFYISVVTFSPCTSLESATGIPIWVAVMVSAGVAMFYTVLGGLKAVVLVDLIQALVMFIAVLVVIIFGFTNFDGGITNAFRIASEGGRLDFIDWNPDLRNGYSIYAMLLPSIIANAKMYATSQAAIQRYSALPNVRQAQWSIASLGPQVILLKLLLFLMSIAIFAHFDNIGCDPLRGKLIKNMNQLTTFYVTHAINYPGFIGVWFAGLFSGSLSTMSTGYNSGAAMLWEDFLKQHLEKRMTKRQVAIFLKFLTFMFALVTCLLALGYDKFPGSVIQLLRGIGTIFGIGTFITFMAGCFLPFVDTAGAIFGIIIATLISIFFAFGQMGGAKLLGLSPVSDAWLPTKIGNCTAYAASIGIVLANPGIGNCTNMYSNQFNSTSSDFMTATVPQVNGLMNGSIISGIDFTTIGAPNLLYASLVPDSNFTSTFTDINLMPSSTDFASLLLYNSTVAESTLEGVTTMAASVTETVLSDIEVRIRRAAENLTDSSYAALSGSGCGDSSAQPGAGDKVTPMLPVWKVTLGYLFSISPFVFSILAMLIGLLAACFISIFTGGITKAKHVDEKTLIVKNCYASGKYDEYDLEIDTEYVKANDAKSEDGDVDEDEPGVVYNPGRRPSAWLYQDDGSGPSIAEKKKTAFVALQPTLSTPIEKRVWLNVHDFGAAVSEANHEQHEALLGQERRKPLAPPGDNEAADDE